MTTDQSISTPIDTRTFVLCVAIRVLQGIAAFGPIALCLKVGSWGILSAPAVAAGAVSSGMALGVLADRNLRSVVGPDFLVRGVLSILTAGLWGLVWQTEPEFTIIIGFVLGIVVGTEWSTISELARRTRSTKNRWKGVRIWTTAFFAGAGFAISLLPLLDVLMVTAAIAATLCLIISMSIKVPKLEVAVEKSTIVVNQDDSEPATAAVDDVGNDEGEGCDATECCGGSKPWRQTAFLHGVVLSAVGWVILFAGLQLLISIVPTANGGLHLVLVGVGFLLGAGLIFSAAPATGYAVALLPFLVVAIVGNVVVHYVEPVGWAKTFGLFVVATAFGAIHCGVKLTLGELFSDCSTAPLRTRVVASSLFATSITAPAILVLQEFMPDGVWRAIPVLLVLVAGIACLRSLPSPIISSEGEDNPDVPEDELQDVMATIGD